MRFSRRLLLGLGVLLGVCLACNWLVGQLRLSSLPHYGTTTDRIDGTDNLDAERRFFAAYERGDPGRWRHVVTTVEGDPVIQQITFEGKGQPVRIVVDARRDRFGSGRIERYRCQGLALAAGRIVFVGCDE